jgi:tetratricopeptide (TPR) repeat protein
MYNTISEAPIFSANRLACMILTVQTVGKLTPEMIKSALSEENYLSGGIGREPDIKLDGARLFYKRGQDAFQQEEFGKAKNYFARAVEIAPHYRDGWFALAGTCELLGCSDEAADAFKRAQELARKP